jgi:hypothetical protein
MKTKKQTPKPKSRIKARGRLEVNKGAAANWCNECRGEKLDRRATLDAADAEICTKCGKAYRRRK